MISEENKNEIIKITKDHFSKFSELTILDYPLEKKVEIIYNNLVEVYKKLSEAKVLPENVDLQTFFNIVIPRLEHAAQSAHAHQLFRNFL